MSAQTLSYFAQALGNGEGINFVDGMFRTEHVTQYGGHIPVALTLAEVRDNLQQIVKMAFHSLEELEGVREYLNDGIQAWEDYQASLSPVQGVAVVALERRTRQEWSPGLLGVGSGMRMVHEVLVEYQEDWADLWGADEAKVGDRRWVEVPGHPVKYDRL
jgi:hypothetical protein